MASVDVLASNQSINNVDELKTNTVYLQVMDVSRYMAVGLGGKLYISISTCIHHSRRPGNIRVGEILKKELLSPNKEIYHGFLFQLDRLGPEIVASITANNIHLSCKDQIYYVENSNESCPVKVPCG